MKNTLIISIYRTKELSDKELEQKLKQVFEVAPIPYKLPINKEIKTAMTNGRGLMNTYKLVLGDRDFEKTLFTLLIQLEEFGFDWKFRKPMKIVDDNFLFLASLFPEFGNITISGINGITVVLNEEF